jgi:hypothetical protein
MRKKFTRAKKRYIASHRKRLHHIKRIGKKPLFTVPIATFMVLLLVVVGGLFLTSGGHPQLRPNDPNVVVISYDKQERIVPMWWNQRPTPKSWEITSVLTFIEPCR